MNWDIRFLNLAKEVATWSKDPSTRVGSVIVRPDRTVASLGFNGFPMAMEDHQHLYDNREEKYERIIHAEMNAILTLRERANGYTCYTFPFLSCHRCFVHIAQAGISRVVAPKATEDQLTRWGASFAKTKQYAFDTGVEVDEIDLVNNTHETIHKNQ